MDTSPAGPVLQATQAHRIGRAFTPTSDSDEDSETSRDRTSAGYVPSSPFVSAQPILRLPTRWSEQDRHASITVSVDGRELHFHGPTNTGDKEAAAARTNHPIPPACGIFYYEVEILNKGQKGYISIGFSIAGVRLNRLPGWEKNSWGYHGDDGHSFVASEKDGSPFGPRFSTGDVIGCGIDFSTYKAFYTKNGAYLGTVFDGVGEHDPIYPSIGLRSAGEAVRVNFGQEPFKYDIDYHVHQTREREWANIQEIPVTWLIDPTNNIFTIEADKSPMAEKASAPTPVMDDHAVKDETGSAPPKDKIREEVFVPIKLPQDFQTPINKLVLSYLTHHGYEKTARAFQTQLDAKRGVRSAPKHLSSSSSRDPRVNGSVDTDIKMETEDMTSSVSQLDFDGLEPEGPNHDELQSRQRIVNAVLTGDIDRALEETRERHPAVLEREDGIMLFKLRCRKFVELVLESSEALKRVKADAEASEVEIEVDGKGGYDGRDSGNAMEVDDDNAHLPPTTNGYANGTGSAAIPIHRPSSRKREVSRPPLVPSVSKCQTTLSDAVAYGKQLQADYKGDTRPEVQSLFKRTFGLVAYDDPLEAGGDVAELASQEARSRLAQEVNQAILESQGRPSRPALERMYRQTSATLTQLGLMGVGAAAFADMTNEFLDL
ncbi:SPRY-domain-containing protein [Rickenella mellea]|uniref:SPRY-domain-containing protein n=1 Tax=Rickenella mellea TaxID=50990 RepID=A0A4Y7QMR5_9AGAM|nr:SPRY-domain-containing protein [Rickenella mellea]